jgi:hypothetical protein
MTMEYDIVEYGNGNRRVSRSSRSRREVLRQAAADARTTEAETAMAVWKIDAIVEVGEEVLTGLSHLTDCARSAAAAADPTKQVVNATILQDAMRHCRRVYDRFAREL